MLKTVMALLLAQSVLCGCEAVAPYRSTRAADGAPVDLRAHDAAPDRRAPTPDSGRDQTSAADAGGGDGLLDDHGLDAPIVTSDGPVVPPPCSDLAAPAQDYPSATMVVCEAHTSPDRADQCGAEKLCNAPHWKLCTAGQFLARGGDTIPATKGDAWLKSCARDYGTFSSPTNELCKQGCGWFSSAANLPSAWTCGPWPTGLALSAYDNLGVMTAKSCSRPGSAVAQGAYYKAAAARSAGDALCCR